MIPAAVLRRERAVSLEDGVQRPALSGELAIAVCLLFFYDHLRSLAPLHRTEAVQHGLDLLGTEGLFGFEARFNAWTAQSSALSTLSVWYYQLAHIGVAFAVLAWCYRRRPDAYRFGRNALITTNVVGLAAFALYPVAPPRLLPGAAFTDLVARAGFGSSHGPLPMNAYAAMPSLHLAWAVCVAAAGIAGTRRWWARALFALHPGLTAVVVVATGNHYVADVAAGTALGLAASFGAAGVWARRSVTPALQVMPVGSRPARPESSIGPRHTVVSFHAHPDDESLFTGGTLARLAAEGNRVVVVVATLGEAGLTGADHPPAELATMRLGELHDAAHALGCARVEWLGYADSGRDGLASAPEAFASADTDEAATRLARLLIDEDAGVLTTYDRAGGYGHPDHRKVHDVGARAAQLAATPLVLEATADRAVLHRAARVLRLVPKLPREFRPASLRAAFSPTGEITHRVDVTGYIDAKRAAMRAHASQHSGGAGPRALSLYLRLPRALFVRAFGHEWFIEPGRTPTGTMLGDPLATLRDSTGAQSGAMASRGHRGNGRTRRNILDYPTNGSDTPQPRPTRLQQRFSRGRSGSEHPATGQPRPRQPTESPPVLEPPATIAPTSRATSTAPR